MDPPSIDPPPVPAATTTQQVAAPAPIATPTPTPPPAAQHHPPYAEMITAAITALDEREGSSKRAIAKYIEAHYTSLPPTHDSLLTTHLKRLKTNGQLQMVKHSYTLPRSAPAIAPLVSTAAANGSDVPKRRPGRPPKLKPAADAVQPAVPVFPAPAPFSLANNSVPPVNPAAPPQAVFVASPTGSVNGPAAPAGPPTRGRGRPPLKRGRGRPPKNTAASGPTVAPAVVSASGGSGRGRGRPRKNVAPTGDVGVGAAQQAAAAATTPVAKGLGRPRGRPPKPINVAPVAVPAQPAAASVVVGVKRRGRPPKAGVGASAMQQQQAKRPRKLSGKPLGRPRKDTAANVNPTPDSQLLVSYLDMKAKLDNLHSRIQQTVTIVKPCLDNEAAINALQELEIVAAANVSAPPSAQSQPPLPQPQPEQPLVQQPQVQS